jgi:serine/alanine adding enzyme
MKGFRNFLVHIYGGIDEKVTQKKALYTPIRTMLDTSNISSFLNSTGYEYEDRLNFLIDLNRSEEEVWRQIHRSMMETINEKQRNGVIIEDIDDKPPIQTFYVFLKDVYHHAKMPVADISLFEAIYDILVPKGMAKFHLTKHNGEYIGGRLSLMSSKTIYVYLVGVLKRYTDLNANPLLNWHAIEWGSENGYHTGDFGGAGKQDEEYGVREFKRRFGGELVSFGRYKKIQSPIKL